MDMIFFKLILWVKIAFNKLLSFEKFVIESRNFLCLSNLVSFYSNRIFCKFLGDLGSCVFLFLIRFIL